MGRTQEIIYYLNELSNSGRLPDIPVYVDSPLAISATDVFRFMNVMTPKRANLCSPTPTRLISGGLRYVRETLESKLVNNTKQPCIVIAGSGMCGIGRVLHHLIHNIERHSTTILFLGFNATDPGRRIADGAEKVRIMGDEYRVRANVEKLSGLSAHADHGELLEYIGRLSKSRAPENLSRSR